MRAQTIHRVSEIDYLSNVSNVINGENRHIIIVKILLQRQSIPMRTTMCQYFLMLHQRAWGPRFFQYI